MIEFFYVSGAHAGQDQQPDQESRRPVSEKQPGVHRALVQGTSLFAALGVLQPGVCVWPVCGRGPSPSSSQCGNVITARERRIPDAPTTSRLNSGSGRNPTKPLYMAVQPSICTYLQGIPPMRYEQEARELLSVEVPQAYT